MDGFKVRTQLWVVLPEAVHAMRTVRNDPFRAMPHSKSFEGFDVLSGKLLEQQFVTHAPGGLPRATFGIAKHSEVDVGCLQEFYNAASDLLQPMVVGRGAADPVDHLAIGMMLHVWDTKASSPRHTILRDNPPWVAGATVLFQRLSSRSAKLAVGYLRPAHIHDKRQR